MNLIFPIFKKSALDLWEEMLYMLLFNVIWLVGTFLIIPWPFVTFALFYTAYDISDGKGIKFKTFFSHGYQMLKPAYTWGLINALVLLLVGANLLFYAGFGTQWAALMQLMFVSLTVFWMMLQIIVVALYPRMVTPGLKLGMRNAAVLMGKHPIVTVFIFLVTAAILALASIIPVFAIFLAFSFITIVITNMVDVLLKKELAVSNE